MKCIYADNYVHKHPALHPLSKWFSLPFFNHFSKSKFTWSENLANSLSCINITEWFRFTTIENVKCEQQKNINDLCCWKCLHMWVGNHLKIHYYTCMHENVYFTIIYFYHSISCTTQLNFIVDIFCGCIHCWNGLQIWITFQ